MHSPSRVGMNPATKEEKMELNINVVGEDKADIIRKLAAAIAELAADNDAKPSDPDVTPQWGGGGGP